MKLPSFIRKLRGQLKLHLLPLIAKKHPPVLCYTTGKVASTSIANSLIRMPVPNPVYNVHFLSEHFLEMERGHCAQNGQPIPPHAVVGEYLSRFEKHTRGKLRWKLITVTRDPLAREVSAVFENLPLNMYPRLTHLQGGELVDGVLAHMEEYLRGFDESEDYANQWFDYELKGVFGLDVFAQPLDFQKGYAMMSAAQADLLLMRQEDLQNCAAQAIREFLGVENFTLRKVNDAAQKDYNDVYRQVLDKMKYPPELLEKFYQSRYARHFYSDAEIETFKKRWGR